MSYKDLLTKHFEGGGEDIKGLNLAPTDEDNPQAIYAAIRTRYDKIMLNGPNYLSTIYLRLNIWNRLLEGAMKQGIYLSSLANPIVQNMVKCLDGVHGAHEQYPELKSSTLLGINGRLHDSVDPEEKRDYIFFRVTPRFSGTTLPQKDTMLGDMFENYVDYGCSEYYGPYVHRINLAKILLEHEGIVTPIDNLGNAGLNKQGSSANEEFAYRFYLNSITGLCKRFPELINIIQRYHPTFGKALKDGTIIFKDSNRIFHSLTFLEFRDFLENYPLVALTVFNPAFMEVMVKGKLEPDYIEYKPINKAGTIDKIPLEYRNSLKGIENPFESYLKQ